MRERRRGGPLRAPRPVWVLPLLLLAAFPAPAQDPQQGGQEQAGKAAGSAPEQEQAGEEAGNLLQQTMAEDIDTAGYYELLAWCRQLGLPDTGSRRDLQKRLYAHYGVAAPQPTPQKEEGRRLEIKSAVETSYFTIQEIDENYVLLQGDVLVELTEKGATHRIRARRVELNQSASLLTAEGDVEYTVVQDGHEESFKGDKLTFNVENWQGVFFGGGMEAERQVGKDTLLFRFLGSTISKLEDDTVVMNRGRITSSPHKEPNYQIAARRIWILAPGEWAISSAVLYVGRVPVLYLPFFFHPGEEFFFHPSIGSRPREGAFLQTTSYFLGQKPRTQSPISLLALTGEEQQPSYPREVRGLFLRTVEGEKVPEKEEKRFFKVMLDAYSRLGAFIGAAGDFPPYAGFTGGIGFSRNIYTTGGTYTPWVLKDGVYGSEWNRSWLLGLSLPFRYGLTADLSLASGPQRLTGSFDLFSDPYFAGDFFDRSENVDWAGMLGLAEETTTPTYGEMSNLAWELTGQADLSSLLSQKWLNRLSVPYLTGSLYWQSRELATDIDGNPVETVDPSRRFYVPTTLKLPGAAVVVGGQLLDWKSDAPSGAGRQTAARTPGKSEAAEQPPARAEAGPEAPAVRPPEALEPAVSAGQKEGAAAAEKREQGEFRLPERKPDAAVPAFKTPLAVQLSYQVRPNGLVQESFDTTGVSGPWEVGFNPYFTSLEASATSQLSYSVSILDKLLGLSGSLLHSAFYRTRVNQAFTDLTQWQQLVLSDYQYSRSDLRTTNTLSLFPVADDPQFGGSNLSYSLSWTFYRYLLDSGASVYGNPVYQALGPTFDMDTVTDHRLQATLAYQPGTQASTLALSAVLPPLMLAYTARLDLYAWLLRTTVTGGYRQTQTEPESVWQWDPLVAQETLQLAPEVKLSQEVRFDLEEGLLQQTTSSASLYGLSASFTAKRLAPIDPAAGFALTGEPERLLPSTFNLGLRLSPEEIYFWKNRIQMDVSLESAWLLNIQRFTDSTFTFSLSFNFFIYKFLELKFSALSYNNHTYRYIPALASSLGEPWVNPVADLLDSFNFFDVRARYRSSFKAKSVAVEAVHHLEDWDLTLRYEGQPELRTDAAGNPQYRWEGTFAILVRWKPIPEVQSNLLVDPNGLSLRG